MKNTNFEINDLSQETKDIIIKALIDSQNITESDNKPIIKKESNNYLFYISIIAIFIIVLFSKNSNNSNGKTVKSSIDYKGKFKKEHFRKEISTDKNSVRNQAKNKYYYETHKEIIKYRKEQKND